MFMYSSFMLLTDAENNPGLDHHKLGVVAFVSYAFQTSLPDTAIPVNPNQGNATGNTTGNGTGNTTGNTTSTTSATNLTIGGLNITTSRAGTPMAPTENSLANSTSNTTSSPTSNTTANTTAKTGNTTANSTANSTADDGSTSASNNPAPVSKTSYVAWGWPPGVSTAEDPSLTFVLPTDSPIIVWAKAPACPFAVFSISKLRRKAKALIWSGCLLIPPT